MNPTPRKRFGQHFLQDRSIVHDIVNAVAPLPGQTIVEIGPGTGVLTAVLLERGVNLQAIEIDRDLCAALREKFQDRPLAIHEGDVLKFPLAQLGNQVRLVGNLPYNISTPLLFHIADSRMDLKDCHFMLQKEVVDRMAAEPSSSDYGRLSVMIQVRFDVEKLFDVPPTAFHPPPKVDSAVVRLTPQARVTSHIQDMTLFQDLVRQAFTQRRKMIRNALGTYAGAQDWEQLGLAPTSRPEDLSVQDFARLANHLARRASVCTTGRASGSAE